MRVATSSRLILALIVSAALSGCVVPTGPVEVTRFNRVAEGQAYGKGSFVVALADDANANAGLANGELAASPYLESVAREMQRLGYSEGAASAAGNGMGSDVVALISVDIAQRLADKASPVSVGIGGGTGGYGSVVGLGIGFNLGGGAKEQLVTTLSVKIKRSGDNLVIWEGRASQAAGKSSPAAQPGIAASKLASALFGGFPGNNGETIEVK